MRDETTIAANGYATPKPRMKASEKAAFRSRSVPPMGAKRS